MSALAWAGVVVCLIVVIVGFAVVAPRFGRSARLKRKFGPEYDRMLGTTNDRRQAEAALTNLVRSREALPVTPLSDDDRRRFGARWTDVQARFVDDPLKATDDADRLVVEVMTARGYRTKNPAFASDDGFEERAGLLSCDYLEATAGYRSAHATRTAARTAAGGTGEPTGTGEHSTEKLRTALVHYRTVFVRLIDGQNDGVGSRPGAHVNSHLGARTDGAARSGSKPADTESHRVSTA